jgi:phosphoglycerate dehydrogenase-like enzyme
MLALFLGEAARPFHDRVPPLLATAWRTVLVTPEASEAERRALLAEATAVVATHYGAAPPDAPALRLVQVPGAGYDGIELTALPVSATLCNVFEHEPGVAEFALLAMLEWCHRLGPADAAVRAGDWSRSSRYGGPPDGELFGKTLAVVGFGRIGQAVARRAAAFGMRIIAVNRTVRAAPPEVEALVGLDRLHEALAEADFVVLGCALTPETTGLIDAAALGAMRADAVIVNVARGPVIDEAALWRALGERRIGGAAIDTWWRYPAGSRTTADELGPHPFHTLPNVLLSPHVAGWTTGTVERRTRLIAANLDRLARGEPLLNVVRPGG